MTQEIEKRKEIAIEAAKKAGKILADNFKKTITVRSKGDSQLVTEADLKAEDAIIGLVKKESPKDGILSEESGTSQTGDTLPSGRIKNRNRVSPLFRWIIDPMDGTHNFIHGIDIFGVSVAVEYKKEVVIGIIYMPLANELYVTQKDKGAYCNDKKLSVSKRNIKESTLIYDSSIRYDKEKMLAGLGKLAGAVFNVRMFGSTARHLAYIAEGKAEIDVEFNDKVWDFAAGLLLVEEAGGIATDFQGKKWSTDTKGYVASNGIVHEEIFKLLNK